MQICSYWVYAGSPVAAIYNNRDLDLNLAPARKPRVAEAMVAETEITQVKHKVF